MFAVIGGSIQTLSMPLIDTKTNEIPMFMDRPERTRHTTSDGSFDAISKTQRECRVLFYYDRTTIRFDPILLYIDAPNPGREPTSTSTSLFWSLFQAPQDEFREMDSP